MANKLKKAKKVPHIKPINNFAMLFVLSVFQLLTGYSAAIAGGELSMKMVSSMCIYIAVEWVYVIVFYTVLHRRNFELELIAFFLTGVGLAAIGSVDPNACFKQLLIAVVGIIGYTVLVFILGDVDLCMKLRLPVAIGAIVLLIINLVIGKVKHGAQNWIEIGGITVQPSEFVKVAFIFVGAATLEKIQTSKNIIKFIAFSVACVGALILIKDFGTALVFFVTFLIIAFMNSGDFKTIGLAVSSAGIGGAIVIKYKSYVTARFSSYRHIWEDVYGKGYQQTHILTGIASGGLLGMGIGKGNIRNYFQNYLTTTDDVFGLICEEWGFLFAIVLVLSFAAIAVSAIVNSIAARSAFYSITAVAGAGMLLFQTALNIFGITDVLPLTGVTLPFVSQGGSSMLCCWAVLAFIKASDVRTYNYLGGAKKK
ncbi:MAG: FtsW/RodA/SpoVE family cell cycle protein [Eubacterium sp.]|nr:FtsW/RodA/SpoVE family cell cycle protein [Eubacterium sp.]MDE6767208.1 FtsW/RodA/SpoVE family cell cycle protein [Eubacterium sp.]